MLKYINKITLLLLFFCLLIVAFMTWRWVFIANTPIAVVDITIDEPTTINPLDKVLQKHLSYLENKPQLVPFFTRPSSLTELSSLWVDECEVTQKDFGKFRQWLATQENRPKIDHPAQPPDWIYQSNTAGHKLLGRLNMPVSGVSYFEAYGYCQAAGGRLPTSHEFEAIAGGKQGKLYPWGNEVSKATLQKAMPFRDPTLNVQACGRAELSQSDSGIEDLGNNLLEWVSMENGRAALMGGNAYHRPLSLHALNLIQRSAPLDYRSQYSGFRCVYPRPKNLPSITRQTPWKSTSQLHPIEAGFYPIGTPPNSIIVKMLQYLDPEQYPSLSTLPIKQTPLTSRISKTEINVEQYQAFLRDPLTQLNFFNHPKHPKHIKHTPINWIQQQPLLKKPITDITWWSAWAFANWAGGRLPTDQEWKKIAGARATLHPWGNAYIIGRSIDRNHPGSDNNPRNTNLSDDASLHGVLGFSGNVAEWTSSITHYGNRFHVVVKGGSFILPKEATQVSQAAAISPNYHNPDLGFRVIFPLPSGEK